MKPGCRAFEKQIAPALLGELDPLAGEALDRHLSSCEACAAERDHWRDALAQLESLEDSPVPRPFFLPSSTTPARPWNRLKQLPMLWRVAFSATLVVSALVTLFSLSSLQLRLEDGVLSVGFGTLPTVRTQEELTQAVRRDIKGEVLGLVDAYLREHDQSLAVALGAELSDLRSMIDTQQQAMLGAVLEQQRNRLERSFRRRSDELHHGVRDFLELSYDQFQDQYRTDLENLSQEVSQTVARDLAHEKRMEELSYAVLEIAGSSLPKRFEP